MLIQSKFIFFFVGSAFCDSCQISTSLGIHVFSSQVESEKTADRKTQRWWIEKSTLSGQSIRAVKSICLLSSTYYLIAGLLVIAWTH